MKASTLSFRSAVSLGVIGIAAGIAMAASGNHAAMSAHAHLNLLGWVSPFLIGIFYRLHPAIDLVSVLSFWGRGDLFGTSRSRAGRNCWVADSLRRHASFRLSRVPSRAISPGCSRESAGR